MFKEKVNNLKYLRFVGNWFYFGFIGIKIR